MKLKTQAYVLALITLVGFLALTATGLWTLRVASNLDNKSRVTEIFTSTYNMLTEIEKMVQDGVLPETTAKEMATRMLRNNIYKDNEYVYVADNNMIFIAAPLDPQLHGTSFNDFKTSDGDSVGQLIQQKLAGRTGQLIEYTWDQRQPDGSVEEKLSIAEKNTRLGLGCRYRYWV